MDMQPGGMDDVESQAPHGDTGVQAKKANKKALWVFGIGAMLIVGIVVGVVVPLMYNSVDTQYSVKIDSVSGLDPATGLSFNVTLGVASRSHGAKACINPGMSVEVFYHGVQIAVSEAEVGQLCAGPRKAVEKHVVARATGVPVGHVLDSLTTEMKQGVAVYDLKLNVPANSYGGIGAMASWLNDCKGTQVGDAAVLCESPDQS